RNLEKKGIAEEQIGVCDLPKEVVANPKGQIESIKSLFSEHCQILRPHLAIVEPRLILDVAREESRYTSHAICWFLNNISSALDCRDGIFTQGRRVGEFQ